MGRSDLEILDRLGAGGLARVLDALLDHGRIVRLANACALRYPGMRAQSQKRERLVADLADRARSDESARKTVFRTLRKETSAALREWSALDAEARRKRVEDDSLLAKNGNLGRYLFLLASGPGDGAGDEALRRLLAREEAKAPAASEEAAPGSVDASAREAQRFRKKQAELLKKIAHLEGQVAKGRDAEKELKRDLMRRKGELAESRMLAERLRKELQEARDAAAGAAAAPAPPSSASQPAQPDGLAADVRKLLADQRKLLHRMEKMAAAPPPAAILPAEALEPALRGVEDLAKEIAGLRRERKRDLQEQERRIEGVLSEIRALKVAVESAVPARRAASRRKGEPERVGVFIDVQNMYYAARQLKGKLDFDALLGAAILDRRLIQALAYVVETKEIDQSGFIAMLQQRAIEVRRKTLTVRSDGSMKGDWDMEMALDILDAAPRLDVVVLVSGDGDFTSLVNRVKAMGPKVEVIGFPRNTAKSLLEAADRFQPLDRRFMIRTPESGPPRQTPSPAPARAADAPETGGGDPS